MGRLYLREELPRSVRYPYLGALAVGVVVGAGSYGLLRWSAYQRELKEKKAKQKKVGLYDVVDDDGNGGDNGVVHAAEQHVFAEVSSGSDEDDDHDEDDGALERRPGEEAGDDDTAEDRIPSTFHKPQLPEGISYVRPGSQSKLKLFAGSSHPALAAEISAHLGTQLGRTVLERFADGEVGVRILDNVRGKDVFVIQSTCAPLSDNLMELLLLISTLKRSSAHRVTAVIPYFGYGRQIEMPKEGGTVAAADIARLLEAVGVDQVVAVELHKDQVQGMFRNSVPVQNLGTARHVVPYFLSKRLRKPVIVSPSGQGFFRAKRFQKHLNEFGVNARLGLLYVAAGGVMHDVDHEHHHAITSDEELRLVGDVRDCDVVLVDDMVDTASRVVAAAETLKSAGARRVFTFTTHSILTGDAVENINDSDITEVVCFNTVPLAAGDTEKIRQLTVSPLIAAAIRLIHNNKTVSDLFEPDEADTNFYSRYNSAVDVRTDDVEDH